ncbi:MAG: ABC transporter ATP-binding protein [Pirellulales bacterium]
MSIIEIKGLKKTYQVYQKKEGLRSSLRGLFKREYKQVKAVQGIDLQIEQGEFVAFLGPNGAGKTTTLKLLSGVIHPTSGTATVMGHTPWQRENEYRRRFALVMGNKNQLWWDLPAQESFRLHQQIYRIEGDVFQNTLDELTDLLDLRDLLQQPVRELSLGQRMKMELTAALLHSPEVLFLDEPTIGLDVVAQHNIQQFLKYYQQKRKITILLTSHYMKDVAALCKRVVIIADGLIKYDGSLEGIIESTDKRKMITLQFRDAIDDSLLAALRKFGDVTDVETPRVKLTVTRDVVSRMLSSILDDYQVDDIVVEDPPLEDIIAAVFSEITEGRVNQLADGEFESIGDGQGL